MTDASQQPPKKDTAFWTTLDEWIIGDGKLEHQQPTTTEPRDTVHSILAEVVPCCARASATQLLMYINQAVAVVFVSHLLGPEALAPFGIAISFFNVCSASIIVGLIVAMETLASASFGADPKGPGVGQYAQLALCMLGVLCVPLSIFFVFSLPVNEFLFGAELAIEITEFLRSAPFYLAMFTLRAVVNRAFLAEKRSDIPLHGMLFSVIAFPAFAYLLIPHGLAYASYALGIAVCLHVTAMLLLALFDGTTWVSRVSWKLDDIRAILTKERFDDFIRLGLASLASVLATWWVTEVASIFSSRFKEKHAVAAWAIVNNITMVSFVVVLGVSMAVATAVGNRLGANRPAAAKACARVCIAAGVVLVAFNSMIIMLIGDYIFQLYTPDERVLAILRPVLVLIALFHLLEGTQISMNGCFRGAGQQKRLLPITLVSMWLIGVPAMYVLAISYDLTVSGLLYGFALGFLVAIPLLVRSLSTFDWKQLAHDAHEKQKAKQKEAADAAGKREETTADDVPLEPTPAAAAADVAVAPGMKREAVDEKDGDVPLESTPAAVDVVVDVVDEADAERKKEDSDV